MYDIDRIDDVKKSMWEMKHLFTQNTVILTVNWASACGSRVQNRKMAFMIF